MRWTVISIWKKVPRPIWLKFLYFLWRFYTSKTLSPLSYDIFPFSIYCAFSLYFAPFSQQNIIKRGEHHMWGYFSGISSKINLNCVVFDVKPCSCFSLSHFRECQETPLQLFQITTKNEERKSHSADDSKYFVNI